MAYSGSFLLGVPGFGVVLNAMNQLFNPIIAMDPNPNNPVLTIVLIALGVSILTTVAQKLLVDQDKMNEIQEKQKKLKDEMKAAQASGNNKKLAEVQAKQLEAMKDSNEMMTMSFKPMIVTMIPILLIFAWMWSSVISKIIIVLPPGVYYCTLTPVFHWLGLFFYGGKITTVPYGIGWLMWYFICTMGCSQILRKFLGFKNGF